MFSAEFGAPSNWMDLMVLPGIMLVFGWAILLAAWSNEKTYGIPVKWRWVALIPVGLALFIGLSYEYRVLLSPDKVFYNQTVINRKILFAHHFPFLAGAITYALYFFGEKRRKSREAQRVY